MSDTDEGEDSGGIFCQNCSPTTRKLGYYATFFVGLIVFGLGIINTIFSLGFLSYYLIIGGYIILLCPLWIKSPSGCVADMKNALRITSTLIFFAFLVVNTVIIIMEYDNKVVCYILGIGLGLSGIWYFLSFFPNGQKACIACMKSCCCSSSES